MAKADLLHFEYLYLYLSIWILCAYDQSPRWICFLDPLRALGVGPHGFSKGTAIAMCGSFHFVRISLSSGIHGKLFPGGPPGPATLVFRVVRSLFSKMESSPGGCAVLRIWKVSSLLVWVTLWYGGVSFWGGLAFQVDDTWPGLALLF